ncbi:RNA polymerase sigma factor [Luteimonas sp. XNQY3]|nr:RNA polymerase sigma factor [Luteimonas sp. XNQY3]MCD9008253.1 RNA polymerase sigma factor [Luteimonas sp. XNQY3]
MSHLPTGLDDHGPSTEEAGPRAAFDAELLAHRPELLRYMRGRLDDVETAADLAQEALARLMKYRDAPQIEDHRAMLFRIANNLIFEHHRERQRQHVSRHVSLDETQGLATDEPPVEAIVEARQALDVLVRRALAELPPRCRLAFTLNRFDGLSYRQVAERMGVSVKAVEKHITRALVACRAAVGGRDFRG